MNADRHGYLEPFPDSFLKHTWQGYNAAPLFSSATRLGAVSVCFRVFRGSLHRCLSVSIRGSEALGEILA